MLRLQWLVVVLIGCGGTVGMMSDPQPDGGRAELDAGQQQIDAGSLSTAADAGAQPHLDLAWDPSTTSGVTYSVYRATTSGGPYSVLASKLTATTYTDTTVQNGVTYSYVVKAVDAASLESDNSNEATGAP